ncbi:MAG: hypothetical protein JF591_13860, partial [Lysobacter sp.]|nr:hypothetical protein [Lysobacter sp.]
MSKLRTTLLTLAATTSVFAAASASAASFEVWNGASWTDNGIVHFVGPTTLAYLGTQLPCDADFTVAVVAGVANVTNASFSGVSACSSIGSYNLPWPVAAPIPYTGANPPFAGAPTLSPALSTVKISGIRLLAFAYCPGATTTGSITGVLDASDQAGATPANNRFVFKGLLGPCAV